MLTRARQLIRPAYVPRLWPVPVGCVLYLEGQNDPYKDEIRDLSGNRLHGSISGGAWVRNENGLWVLSLDGSNDYVDWGDEKTLEFATGNFAFSYWFRQANAWPTSYANIFGKKATTGYQLRTHTTFGIYFQANGEGGGADFTTYRPTISYGTWTMLSYSVSRSGNNLSLSVYQNEALLGIQTAAVTGSLTNSYPFRINYGYNCGSETRVALVKVFSQAITAGQVKDWYDKERYFFGV